MKQVLCPLLALVCLLFTTGFRKAPYLSGDAIISKMKDIHATESEVELIKMVIVDEDGNTSIRQLISVIKPDSNGNLRYLIRFLSPQDIQGVSLLTLDQTKGASEQYLYLPALGQPRKITGDQKSGYFMGSDFTFEDLRKEAAAEHEYHRLMDDAVEGRDVYAIMSAPAGVDVQNATGYANRILYIDKETFDILKIEFYEEGNTEPIKIFRGFDYNSPEIDGTSKRPQRAVMNNHINKTTSMMIVLKSRLNVDIDESLFDPEQLKSWEPGSDQPVLSLFEKTQK